MFQMKIAAVMMVPLTFCGVLACAQEPQPNCMATATVPSQLKPQTSSPLQPQEVYGTYVPYTGPPVKATPPQSEVAGVTPATCSAASAQPPTPSAQIPPPPMPKPQEEVVYSSYVPYKAPAPKAAPPQVAINEAPPAPCSTASTTPPPPAPALKLQDDPVYGSYVPYKGPPVKMASVEVAAAVPPSSCFTPEAQSSHSSSTPAVAPLELVSSKLESTIEAPRDLPPPSAAAPSAAPASGGALSAAAPIGAARPPVDDLPINPSPIVGVPASTSEFVRLAPPPLSAKEPRQIRPFRSVAIGFKAGSLGTGIELATPFSHNVNLRSNINIFAFDYAFSIDGVNYDARLHLKSSATTLDWFPMRNTFHVSPGILYVKNTLSAPASVKPGQTFVLGTQTFVNSIDDPMSGSASVIYPHSYAPMLLFGFGNIIPRSGQHFSFPVEFGGAYTGAPQMSVALSGTACVTDGCVSFGTSAPAQSFVKQEVQILNNDLKRYPVFPIVTMGMAYHF